MLPFNSFTAFSGADFNSIFSVKKPVLAAIMLEGDYATPAGKEKALKKALDQLKIVKEEGVHSILLEFRGGGILTPAITESNYDGMLES